LAAVALALGAASCGGGEEEATPEATAPAQETTVPATAAEGTTAEAEAGQEAVRTALVLPCPTSDPWCKQGFDAAKALEEQGAIDLQVTTNAPQDTAGVTRVLAQYAEGGTQLILAHSTWQDAAFAVAEQFPDVDIATYAFELRDNVAILEEPIYEAAYLAGILAGGLTESNVIGGTAGQDVPLCHAELEAFEAGAKSVNDQVRMIDTYIGDWNDAAAGKQATQAQIDQGADVVIACGGGPATGMAQAMKENNVSGFGYVGDTSSQAPEQFVGSVIYNLEPYFSAIVEDVRNGTFRPAKTYRFGLAEGGVDLKLNDQYAVKEIPSDVMEEMERVREQILNGEFEVPYVPGT
jgi:basic membrane lipoprotein Med (substrate-binding protein (PBP1-ABC) superfamily)